MKNDSEKKAKHFIMITNYYAIIFKDILDNQKFKKMELRMKMKFFLNRLRKMPIPEMVIF